MLGKDSLYLEHKLIRKRKVGCNKLYTGLNQPGDEVDVPGEAVELGNDQDGSFLLGMGDGVSQYWALVQRIRALP